MTVTVAGRDEVLGMIRRRVVGFAAARAGRETAEDIAQETLMLLTTKYAHLEAAADLVPLSIRIARLKLMNHWRKVRRAPIDSGREERDLESLARDEGNEEALGRQLLLGRVLQAIETLGERCKRLLLLRLEDRDFEEIRKLMDAASINTVYTWDNRCRKQLREALLPEWAGVADA